MGRILDVNTDFETLDEESDFFRRAGVDMIRCLGPDTSAGCPVLNGEACPKVARATVIMSQLDLENEGHRKVLRTYRKSGATVIAVVSPEDNENWASELINVETIVGPPTRADLQRIARASHRQPSDLHTAFFR